MADSFISSHIYELFKLFDEACSHGNAYGVCGYGVCKLLMCNSQNAPHNTQEMKRTINME